MMTQNADKKREQIQMFCMDDMVPQDHLLRIIDKAINWNFIYDLVVDKYSPDNGRPSMDPVMLIKLPFIQYLYGIRSMRQTVKEIEVNVAYRWFLGLEMMDKVPHFSTFGKNYTRRFKDSDLFEQIFSHILQECYKFKLIDPGEVFVDATHVKARANNKKMQKRIAHEEALFFEDLLKKEINEDREAHGKRPLKEKDDNDDNTPSGRTGGREEKTIKTSHHDSRTFKTLYDKIKHIRIETLIMDAGYKTPGIAKLLIDDGIRPLMPYKCPMTKEGFFKKYEYAYDEYYDCYICPNNKALSYSTTNREGYREYKSCGMNCADCPYLTQCTLSKDHVKVVTRFEFPHFLEAHVQQPAILKYSNRVICCDRTFGGRKPLMPVRLMESTRSMAYPMA